MSLIHTSITTRRYRVPHRSELRQWIVECWRRMRSRYELMSLSEEGLRDIGMSRCEADFEASKPFWR